MREIVLDTETTGFDPKMGDRIVEIGCLELINHTPTGNTYHQYINPERGMPEEAFGVHGIGPDILPTPRPAEKGEVILKDKPVFKEVGRAFMDFISDSKLIIHNAAFDMKFLNNEIKCIGYQELMCDRALDTLTLARKKFPGAPASLDALCRRFGIDNTSRTLHGALLDSQILAEVYLELIGGRQPGLVLAGGPQGNNSDAADGDNWRPSARPNPLPLWVSKEELAAHNEFVGKLGDDALWKKFSG